MDELRQRRELGGFLRAHREALDPADFGVEVDGRRRTPGLRREEVADAAGMAASWYAWLEQGRVLASRPILDALARALRLTADEHRHALVLAGLRPPSIAPPDDLAQRMQPMLDALAAPALLVDRCFDVLAHNHVHAALWGDPGAISVERRNLLWMIARDPRLRDGLLDWEPVAIALWGQFRAQADRHPGDPRIAEVLELLHVDSPELHHWWGCRAIVEFTARAVTAAPPPGEARPLELTWSLARPADAPDALILVQAPSDEASRAALARVVAAYVPEGRKPPRIPASEEGSRISSGVGAT